MNRHLILATLCINSGDALFNSLTRANRRDFQSIEYGVPEFSWSDWKMRLESQFWHMNCKTFSTGLSSGHLAGRGSIAPAP